MNIPTFTAAASLHETDHLYHEPVRGSKGAVPDRVTTAQFIHHFPVDCDSIQCYRHGGYLVCFCG
jgi:hypothetical protein